MSYFPARVMPKSLAEEGTREVRNSPYVYNASDYNVHQREIIAIQTMLTGKSGGLTTQKLYESTNLLPTTLVNYYYYLRSLVATKMMPLIASGTIRAGNPIILPDGTIFTRTTGELGKNDTTINVASTYGFPRSGIITKFNRMQLSEFCKTSGGPAATGSTPNSGGVCDTGYKYLDYEDFVNDDLLIKTFQETIFYEGKSPFSFFGCQRAQDQTTSEDLDADEEAIIVCGNASLWLTQNFWSERMTSSTVSAVNPANQFAITVDPDLFVDAVLLEKGGQQVKPDISDFVELSYMISIKPDFTDIDSNLLVNPSGAGSGGSGGPRPPQPPENPTVLPIITTTSLPNGTITVIYPNTTSPGFQLQTSIPVAQYTQQGLPAGLSMSSSGLITGTPTVLGSFTVVITVDGIISKTFTLTIVPKPEEPPVIRVPKINSTLSATGTVGTPFSYTITCDLIAGDAPTFFSIAPTTLFLGLTLNTLTGVISGTPGVAGTANVTLTAANGGGTDSKTLVLTINPIDPGCSAKPSITVSGNTSVYVNDPITLSVNVDNFLQLTVQNKPSTLAFIQGTNPTGRITGGISTAGVYTMTVVASNNCGTTSYPITVTVTTPPPPPPPPGGDNNGGGGGGGGGGDGGGDSGGGGGDNSGGDDDLPPDYEPPELSDDYPGDDNDPELPAKYGIGQMAVSKLQLNTSGKKASIVVNFYERQNLSLLNGGQFPKPTLNFKINDKSFTVVTNPVDDKKLSGKFTSASGTGGGYTISWKFTRPKLKKDKVTKQLPPATTPLKWILAVSVSTKVGFSIKANQTEDMALGAPKSRFFLDLVDLFATPAGFAEDSGYHLHPDEKQIRVTRSSSTKAFAASYDRKKYTSALEKGSISDIDINTEKKRLGLIR